MFEFIKILLQIQKTKNEGGVIRSFLEVLSCKNVNLDFFFSLSVNKHKPWIETTYHGIVTENDNTVLLDPPLIALDKDAPLRFAGK